MSGGLMTFTLGLGGASPQIRYVAGAFKVHVAPAALKVKLAGRAAIKVRIEEV